MEIWIVTTILVAAIYLFVTEKLPVDLTSIGIVVTLVVTGILTPQEAVNGFANPAVITVGSMFLISRGMMRTGAVEYISQTLLKYTAGRPGAASVLVLLIVGLASAFINNTPVVVLFIPIILGMSCQLGLSPSKLLIPVSYASILAGTSTLIGTSTNIIVSNYSALHGFGKLGMFELSQLGVPIALIGIIFLAVAAPRLMPNIHSPICELQDRENQRYLTELIVPKDSSLIDYEPKAYFHKKFPNTEVLELIRYSHIYYPDRDHVTLAPDDILLIKGPASDLIDILHDDAAVLPLAEPDVNDGIAPNDAIIIELIITPLSSLIGERLTHNRLRNDPKLQVVAIQRSGLHYTEKNVQDIKLKIGDILLIRCTEDSLPRLRGGTDFIIIEDIHHEIIHKRLARRAFLIFTAMVVAASSGIADILVCALTAAFLMLLTGCLHLRDAYRALEGRVLLIIVGTLALSSALEKTGASELWAGALVSIFADTGPAFVLAAMLLITSLSTHILSNNATAILLLPIAISAAQGLTVDPRPFIIAVCFGASACFATPVGYQTNLLVYGPGGYRVSDYLKLGIPLNIIVIVLGALFIPVIWPF